MAKKKKCPVTLVAVKLTPTELLALDQVVKLVPFRSRSECLRSALHDLFKSLRVKPETMNRISEERYEHFPRKSTGRDG